MSKTLSANVSNGKDADQSQPVYLIQIIPISGTTLYLSAPTSHYDSGASQQYDGSKIARGGLGSLSMSIDLSKGGNIGKVSNFRLKLSNIDIYSDTFSGTIWENAPIEIRLIFADQADAHWSNAVQIFKGYVEDIEWDHATIELLCIDSWQSKHRKILNDHIITLEEFPTCPSGNVGKVIPVIFGSFWGSDVHRSAMAAQRINGSDAIGYYDHALGYRVNLIPPNGSVDDNVLVCRHVLNKYPQAANLYFRHLRTFDINSWIMMYGAMGTASFAMYRTLIDGAKINHYRLYFVPDVVLEQTGTTNAANAVNENVTDWLTLTSGQSAKFGFSIPNSDILDDCDYIQINAVLDVTGTPVDDLLLIELYESDGTTLIASNTSDPSGWDPNWGTILLTKSTGMAGYNIPELQIKLSYQMTGGDDNLTLKIRNLWTDIRLNDSISPYCYVPISDIPDEIFLPCEGYEYDDWIGSRMGHSGGDLIENPCGMIEAILREILGIPGTSINTDSFDAVETQRSSWKFANELLEASESLKIIQQLARGGIFGYIVDYAGKESLIRMDETGTPIAITKNKMLVEGNHSTLSISKTKLSNLHNAFILNYKRNLNTGNYEKQLYCLHPDEDSYSSDYCNFSSEGSTYWNHCHSIYTNYGIINTWEFNADWIRDDATAELFIKRIIKWLACRRYIVRFKSNLDFIQLEIGDQATIAHDLLPDSISGSDVFNLTGIKMDPGKNELKFEFLDIENAF